MLHTLLFLILYISSPTRGDIVFIANACFFNKNSESILVFNQNLSNNIIVTKNPDRNKVTMQDNVYKVVEELKNKIFQPYFTTKPTGQGTGLGLSLAYDIVKAHSGELSFDSDPATGATFTITFKLTES